MRDFMLRGQPAPGGFASTVSGWIQHHIAQERQRQGPSMSTSVRERLNTVDGCSSAAVAAGDDDPRIRALHAASPGPRWNPGKEQIAVIQAAGQRNLGEDSPSARLTGDKLLAALCHAAMLDLLTDHSRELSQLRKGPEAAPTQKALLDAETQRADNAERQWRQTVIERESASRDYVRERDMRRQLQTVLRNGGVLPAESDEEPAPVEPKRERIPAGVRKRGDAYQAYWRDERGKQKQKDGFATAEEARAFRRGEMERVSKARSAGTAPELSAAGGYDQMTPAQAEVVRAQGLAA